MQEISLIITKYLELDVMVDLMYGSAVLDPGRGS